MGILALVDVGNVNYFFALSYDRQSWSTWSLCRSPHGNTFRLLSQPLR